MNNFYEETIEVLKDHGKTPDDILWIGKWVYEYYDRINQVSVGHYVKFGHKGKTIDEFMRELFNFDYDNEYGREVINPWLLIVGKGDWYMDRGEYAGSEWWNYNVKPDYPDTKIDSPDIKDIVSDCADEGEDYIVPKEP